MLSGSLSAVIEINTEFLQADSTPTYSGLTIMLNTVLIRSEQLSADMAFACACYTMQYMPLSLAKLAFMTTPARQAITPSLQS